MFIIGLVICGAATWRRLSFACDPVTFNIIAISCLVFWIIGTLQMARTAREIEPLIARFCAIQDFIAENGGKFEWDDETNAPAGCELSN